MCFVGLGKSYSYFLVLFNAFLVIIPYWDFHHAMYVYVYISYIILFCKRARTAIKPPQSRKVPLQPAILYPLKSLSLSLYICSGVGWGALFTLDSRSD